MNYLFTSESVSEGHPDKVADQISDAILDQLLAYDPQAHVAVETFVTSGQVVIAGEVKSEVYVDVERVARRVIKEIGYDRSELQFDGTSCGILTAIHEQSPDIDQGVSRSEPQEQGAGDQGMMFGYACDETPELMPLTVVLSHVLVRELAAIRREGKEMRYLRPDAKSQVTVEYDEKGTPQRIHTIVISTQHDDFIQPSAELTPAQADAAMLAQIRHDVETILLPRVKAQLSADNRRLFDTELRLLVNPTGKFVIGGPAGDTGLTGRKIIVDTYGGRGAHGGGAFSGKDPSKVDRSAAYAARHIAKNLVAAGIARQALVQVAYAIGVAEPVSLYVNTYGTAQVPQSDAEIARRVAGMFDMRPHAIEQRFGLRKPIYRETAAYGHVGRQPQRVSKQFRSVYNGDKELTVDLFAWENTDRVADLRRAFGLE